MTTEAGPLLVVGCHEPGCDRVLTGFDERHRANLEAAWRCPAHAGEARHAQGE